MSNLPLRLLSLTRRSANLAASEHPWRALVEGTGDNILLKIVRNCVPKELSSIAYYAIVLNRHRFLKSWWNNDASPQLQKAKQWIDVIIALHLYREHLNKNPLPLLLTVFMSKALRALYPKMLAQKSRLRCAGGWGYAYNWDNLSRLDTLDQLKIFLIELATSLPNGTDLLYREWKQYQYPDIIWNFQISHRHFLPAPIEKHETTSLLSSDGYSPFLQLCRYGNIRDFKVALRNPTWWKIRNVPKDNFVMYPIVAMVRNNNITVLRYFMETVWSVKKVCEQYGSHVGSIVWEACYLSKLFTEPCVGEALRFLALKIVKGWRRRTLLLCWLFPDVCTPALITCFFDRPSVQKLNPRLCHCTYYHFVIETPASPQLEDVLWMSTQQPFVSPKAKGVTYYNHLPPMCHPVDCAHPIVRAILVDMEWWELYLVFDVNQEGRWDERLNNFAKRHKYWRGPYATLKAENNDMQLFLDVAKESGWNEVWWPKGVYSIRHDREFFEMISRLPITPYPNDGWVVAGNKGPLWKIKKGGNTPYFLTAMYTADSGWSLADDFMYDGIVTEFPDEIPKDLPSETITKYILMMLENTHDAHNKDKVRYFDVILSILALNIDFLKNHTSTLLKSIQKKIDEFRETMIAKTVAERYKWLCEDPIVEPAGWKESPWINNGVWTCAWDVRLEKWRPMSRCFEKNISSFSWHSAELISYKRPTQKVTTKQRKAIANFCKKHEIPIEDIYATILHRNYHHVFDIDLYTFAENMWFGSCLNDNSVFNWINQNIKDHKRWEMFMNTIKSEKTFFGTMICSKAVTYSFVKEKFIAAGWREIATNTTELGIRIVYMRNKSLEQ